MDTSTARCECVGQERLLTAAGFTPSLSRHGNCYDNAVAESFFATLRKELVHRTTFATRAVGTRAVIAFIENWYNRRRRHSALDYRSPVDYEREVHGLSDNTCRQKRDRFNPAYAVA